MHKLVSILPDLISEIATALTSEGRSDLGTRLNEVEIMRWTYHASDDAGYIYLIRPFPNPHFAKLAAPVAETISFLNIGFNIDLDHDGHFFGIELLGRPDVFEKLKKAYVR